MTAGTQTPPQTDKTQAGKNGTGTPADGKAGKASGPETARKTTYTVYLGADTLDAVSDWLLTRENGEEPQKMANPLPDDATTGDLIYLGTYEVTGKGRATTGKLERERKAAVEQMLTDPKPSDRVKLVQIAHQAHVDLHLPTAVNSEVKDVPVLWKVEPTFTIGGR